MNSWTLSCDIKQYCDEQPQKYWDTTNGDDFFQGFDKCSQVALQKSYPQLLI